MICLIYSWLTSIIRELHHLCMTLPDPYVSCLIYTWLASFLASFICNWPQFSFLCYLPCLYVNCRIYTCHALLIRDFASFIRDWYHFPLFLSFFLHFCSIYPWLPQSSFLCDLPHFYVACLVYVLCLINKWLTSFISDLPHFRVTCLIFASFHGRRRSGYT